MVDQDGEKLNQLFDQLDNWNEILKPSLPDLEREDWEDFEEGVPEKPKPSRPVPRAKTKPPGFDMT